MKITLLSLGHGYTARALADRIVPLGATVLGTTRDRAKVDEIAATGVTPVMWDSQALTEALQQATHVLASAAPGPEGDPALAILAEPLALAAPRLTWVGYLSTTAVYGDHDGAWVDEDTALAPSTKRGEARVAAEQAWSAIPGLPLHIFRLAGIYGPGRGPFSKVMTGEAKRIIKPGQVFSRIHVEDIAQALHASMQAPDPGKAYNICDNDPAPPQDVIGYAAELLGLPMPLAVDFAQAEMSPMARSFYAENKRVNNARMLQDLGVELTYPNYRVGLQALLADRNMT